MKHRAMIAVVLLASSLMAADKEEGFTPLFDGKSFEGWKVNASTPKSWKINEGLLVLMGGNSHLFTVKPVEDFIIRFEWRAARKGYNSGFLFSSGNQIQIGRAHV